MKLKDNNDKKCVKLMNLERNEWCGTVSCNAERQKHTYFNPRFYVN